MNMKQSILAILLLVAAGNITLRAQSDMIIKQRAKDLRNANDAQVRAQDGRDTPAPANQAPVPAPAPPPPPPSQAEIELKQNLDKLQTDLVAIKPGAPAGDEVKQMLQVDFLTLVKGSVRPSTNSLNKLAEDLAAALSGASSPREQGQLAQAINAVVNSSMSTPAKAQPFVVVAQTSLKSSGVSDAGVQAVTADLKAIVDEVQKKKPKLYQ